MIKLRPIGHAVVAFSAVPIWAVAMCCMALFTALSYLAHWLHPGATRQNCWLYTMWRWHKYGGYLAVVPARGNRFLKVFMVPHVIWIKDLKEAELEQYVPLKRRFSEYMPYYTIYFEGQIISVEPHKPAVKEKVKD